MNTKSIWSIIQFCKINLYGLECFICVCHGHLSIIFLPFLPLGWSFTRLIIMFHLPCTGHAVSIGRDLGNNKVSFFPLCLKFLGCFMSPFTFPCLEFCLWVYRNHNKWNQHMRDSIGRYNISYQCKSHWIVIYSVQ